MLDGPPEISSDSERAPGARSFAVEFSEVRMAVQKLQRGENERCFTQLFRFIGIRLRAGAGPVLFGRVG